MPLSDELLQIVVCPACRGRLEPVAGRKCLDCPACRLRYPVRNGIAMLMADHAKAIDEEDNGAPAGSGEACAVDKEL